MKMIVRIIAAVAVLASGYVHFHFWNNGVKHLHPEGPLFLVNFVAAIAIAILLIAWRTWIPPFLAAGFGATTMVFFIISATSGFYGDHEHWAGSYVWTAFIAEAIAVVAGLAALVSEGQAPLLSSAPGRRVHRPAGV
jgi:hypothetical protein